MLNSWHIVNQSTGLLHRRETYLLNSHDYFYSIEAVKSEIICEMRGWGKLGYQSDGSYSFSSPAQPLPSKRP